MSRRNVLGPALLKKILARTVQQGECRIWTGAVTSRGYGCIMVSGTVMPVHRVVVMITTDQQLTTIDEVCHTCDTPLCVEPEHLVVGTHADNMYDHGAKGRVTRAKLTANDAKAIREEYVPWVVGMHKLAKRYGVSPKAIHQVISRKTFDYV